METVIYSSNGVEINREQWLKEAVESETGGHIHCCRAIVKVIISYGVESEDQKHTWMEDAENVSFLMIVIDYHPNSALFDQFYKLKLLQGYCKVGKLLSKQKHLIFD